ncbi:hypothetical protein F504_3515 (plasmid) [Ralstonia pseudosolanacearum FQY_4]|nr:hypothetical protein F504_3515 [Ralstonia pseudosolanacearum FQY_4]
MAGMARRTGSHVARRPQKTACGITRAFATLRPVIVPE